MSFLFRTDASIEIGSGHVMRCLTLADALKRRGCESKFICREHEGNLIAHIQMRGYEVLRLPQKIMQHRSCKNPIGRENHSEWLGTDWQTDAEETLAAIAGGFVDWLVVDHYALDKRWEVVFRGLHCKQLMVIDDLADRYHECDLLLDQSLVIESLDRYEKLVPSSCIKFLGAGHALLRPEFDNPPLRKRSGLIKHVFVYLGGNDRFNQTGKVVEALKQFSGISAEVVLGHSHPFKSELMASAKGFKNISIVEFSHGIIDSMCRADLSFGACGMAALERCAVGLPSLVIINAENQRLDTMELHNFGAIECLGEAENVSSLAWEKAFSKLQNDSARVAEMGKRALMVVQGHQKNREELIDSLIVQGTI